MPFTSSLTWLAFTESRNALPSAVAVVHAGLRVGRALVHLRVERPHAALMQDRGGGILGAVLPHFILGAIAPGGDPRQVWEEGQASGRQPASSERDVPLR